MKTATAVTIGVVLILLGGVWAFQGAGMLGGSPMTGETLWLVVGSILVVVGLGLAGFALVRKPRDRKE